MWVTCYNCNGMGIEPNKKDCEILHQKENEEIYCHVCERFRLTTGDYNFYGQIWIEDNYEVSTPPSSPRTINE